MRNKKLKKAMSITAILLLLGGAVLYCLEKKDLVETVEIAEAEELLEVGKTSEKKVMLQQQMSQSSKQELLSEQDEIVEESSF